jgi:hypothetical protein
MDLLRRSFLKRSSAMFAAALAPAAFDIESAFAQTGAPAAASSTGGGPPTFVCTDFSHRIDPAYLSSGLVGIRPGPNPLARALTLVSGFVFKHFAYGMETISPAPYPLATDIRVNRVSLLERPDLITFRRQQLDTATGELLTDLVFSAEGVTLQIQVLQFASRSIPSLLCQEIRLVPYQDGELEFAPSIAMEGVPGRVYRDAPPERTEIDLVMGLESHGDLSRLGEAISVLTPDGLTRKGEQVTTAGGVTRSYFLAGKQG